MTIKRVVLVVLLMGLLAGTAFVARETEGPGLRMVQAAEKFLASLDAQQKMRATFDFEDKERTRWFFTPQQVKGKYTRKGLVLEDMTEAQQALARDLLRAGTSETGFQQATTIMSLEAILADLEKKGSIVRNPQWYFFSIFGTPTKTGRWGWRVEGHHLSLNFTVDGGKVVSATPFFLGANPAEVKAGSKKGTRVLGESMDLFRELVSLLDDKQRQSARQPKLFPEIDEARTRMPEPDRKVGISAESLNAKQREVLHKLIASYAKRMPPEVAAVELAAVKKAQAADLYFAYAGGDGSPGIATSYRIQGPTFRIEYINEQRDSAGNPANHIHSVWRNVQGDFGLMQ